MLDVPWVGIVRIESLKVRSEHDLGTESGGIQPHARRCLHRKAGGAAISGTTGLGTIQVAADPRDRSSSLIALRLLAAIRQLRQRAPTLLLVRTNAHGHGQHDHR